MATSEKVEDRLTGCHGFRVVAAGRHVGFVETPVFANAAGDPAYLIVRTDTTVSGTFRAVPVSLVDRVDSRLRLVMLHIGSEALACMPERLPLERRART